MNWNEDAACRSAWRRIFSRSPIVLEVLNEGKRKVPKYNKDGSRAKVDRVEFHCQVHDGWVPGSLKGKSNIAVDHIIPVIDTDNTDGKVKDWNIYHDRLFCDKSNLQRICKPCHQKKTNDERTKRNTIKYNLELDVLEKEIMDGVGDAKAMRKQLAKYRTKTKPQAIRDRANGLLVVLLNPPRKAKKRRKK